MLSYLCCRLQLQGEAIKGWAGFENYAASIQVYNICNLFPVNTELQVFFFHVLKYEIIFIYIIITYIGDVHRQFTRATITEQQVRFKAMILLPFTCNHCQ